MGKVAGQSFAHGATYGAAGPHNGGNTAKEESTRGGSATTRRNAAGRGRAGQTDYDWKIVRGAAPHPN